MIRPLFLAMFGMPILMIAAPAAAHEECFSSLVPFTDSGKAAATQYNRDRPMDIKHIRLDIRVDVVGERIEGTATQVFAPVGTPLSVAEFDAMGMDITRVTLGDGAEVQFEEGKETLKVFLPSALPVGEDVVLKIDYSTTRPLKGMHFRTPRMGYAGDEVQCWTQGEAEDARYWFPCYDAPSERTTTEVVATVPAAFRAVSNGELVDVKENTGDATRTFHYRLDKEHTTYLVSLAVGNFVEVRDEGSRVPLYYYVLPGQEEKVKLSYGRTGDMMNFFEERLGVAYPWGRYSQVAVVDFIAGGMENTSITTMTERSVQDAAARLTNLSEHLVAHELAHQWFGDLVTTRDWTNIWLNEGWATFLETAYIEHAFGADWYDHRLWENAQDVFDTDKPENRLATVRKVWGDPEALFDARVYEKGAWIIHMLREQFGEEVFWLATKTYLEQHANQAVETNDLLRTFEEVSGEALEQFFDQWVFHAGWPEFKVNYEWDAAQSVAKVKVEQTQKIDEKTLLFKLKTALRFVGADYTRDEPIEILQRNHTYFVALPSRPEYVLFDPANSVLKRVEFERSKDALIAQLTKETSAAALYDACAALGKLSDEGAVEALVKALNEDAFWGVRARAVEALAGIDNAKAEEAVIAALTQPEARVRLAAAKALAKSASATAHAALAERIGADESPYVAAVAIDSLAQQQARKHLDVIRQALGRDSQNQVLRSAALSAVGKLAQDDVLAELLPYTTMDAPRMSRWAAIAAVGASGEWLEDKAAHRVALEELLAAPNASLRRTAAGALATLGDVRAVPALEAYALAAKDEQEQKAGRESAGKLRDRNTAPQALKQLQEQLDAVKKDVGALQDEKKKLQERLDAADAAKKAATAPEAAKEAAK